MPWFRRARPGGAHQFGSSSSAPARAWLPIAIASLLNACSGNPYGWNATQNSISGMVVPLNPVAGSSSSLSRHVSASSAALCPSAEAHLYNLSPAGERILPALQTVPVKADGTYAFTDLRQAGIKVRKVNKLDTSFLVEVTGCNAAYGRLVTATDKQNIDWATTLVSYVTGTGMASNAASAAPANLEALYQALASSTDFNSAYSMLAGNPALSAKFQNQFQAPPVVLEDASPMLVDIRVPATMREGETQTFSLSAVQWNPTYVRAYRWELDGIPFSHNNSVNFAAHGNSQGNHTVTVSWGQSDGFGDVDTTKPYRQRSFPLAISDDLPARAPLFAAVPALVNTTNLTLRLQTGSALENCATFSRMAITEDVPVAPVNPADYTLSCSAGPTEDFAYPLQGGVGIHVIYLWAIDARGNISVLPRTTTVHYNDAIPFVDITSPLPTAPPFQNSVLVSGACDASAGDVTLSGDLSPVSITTACSGGSFSQSVTLSAGDGNKGILASQTNSFGSTGSDSLNVSRDATPPSVSLSSLAPDPTNSSPIVVSVLFSEAVTGFDITKPILTNATIASISGGGSSYSLAITPTGQGPFTVAIPAGVAQDAAGNGNLASATLSRTYDSVAPTTVLATSAANPTNLAAVPFTVTFSESVTGFTSAGITITNGSIAGFTGSGTTFSFNVIPSAQGIFTVRVNGSAAQDAAANGNVASNLVSLTFDNIRPGVTLATTAAEPTNSSPIPVTVTFTEVVTGFSLSDLSLTGGTAANLTGSGSSYTFDLVPSGQGAVSVSVNANTSQDAATNQNTASNTLTRTYDSVAPTTLLATSAGTYSRTSPFAMTITFSKPVTGLTLAGITVTNGTASALAGTGATYTFTLTPGAEGTVTARVNAAAAQDSATNPSDISNLVSIVYDITAPTLAVTTPSNGAYVNAANQNAFTVSGTCSENGQSVQLAVGAVTHSAACTGGNFSASLNLSSLTDGALTLTANLQDLAGNVAPTQSVSITKDILAPTATLSGVPASPSNTTSLAVTVAGTDVSHYRFKVGVSGSTDCSSAIGYSAEAATAAQITNSIAGLADGSLTLCAVGRDSAGNYQAYGSATSATWMKDTGITPFSGLAVTPASPGRSTTPAVSGSTEGNASVSLFKAASCGGPAIATGTAAAGGGFSLTPGASLGADGAYNLSVRSTDAAGNTVCSATIPYLLDTTAPTVTISSTAPNPTNTAPIPITVTFSESVTGFSAAGLTLVNGTASSITGSGTTYTFSITPSAQGNVSVTVNAAAAKDSALNDNVASATLTRLYDSIAPPLTIASPAVGAGTNQNHLVFSGACEDGISIVISGSGAASPASATCSGGNYSVDIQFTAGEGIKNINLTQTDAAGNATVRNRAVPYDATPPALTFASAAVRDQLTNTNSVTFSGSCESGTNVVVAGGVDSSSVPCSSSVWSYTTAAQTSDGLRTYTFTQTDPGNNTTSITGTWTRDATPPALTRVSPPDGTRAKDYVTVTGACETGLTISFTGAGILSPLTPICSGSSYSQDVFFSTGDGTKAITIAQTDAAGNTTTVTTSFVRDNVAPALTQTLVSSPYWTNTNSATFGGACETGLPISVTRDGSAEGTATCAAGTWTYTTATQTTDATRAYAFTQVDQATNAATVSAQWIRRTTNPAFAFTSASSFSTSSNTVTFFGTCMTGVNVQITGADTNSTPCSGGNWSYTTNAQTTDATRTYNLRQTDPAGNYTAIVGTWTRNTNLPQLTLTSTSPFFSNGNNTTFTGGCSNGLAITVSGAVTDSIACSGGTWSYPASQGADGSYTYTFNQTDTYGNSTTVNAVWRRDTQAPAAATFSLNSGAGVTNTSYVRVGFTGSDSATNITRFCLKTTNAAPAAGDSCWIAVNANPPGLTPATSLNLANFSYYLGISPGMYTVYGWLQDAAGNISVNGAAAGVDRASIDYQIIYPPVIDTMFATNTNTPGFPVPSPQLSVSAGAYVYIKWRATASGSLGATPIKLSFTTNDSSWSTIANVANAQGANCSLGTSSADAGVTGCYRWTAPTSGFMRIRIEVADTGGRSTGVTPPPLNTGTFKLIAGNTEPGTNTSTLSSVYLFRKQFYPGWVEPNSFAITTSGVLYLNDHSRGILKVDPADGLTTVFIPKTGTTSGNGAVSSATLRNVYGITLDFQDRLLIWDNDQIRRVDFTTNQITRIIGGGSSTADTIADARDLRFQGYMPLPVDADSEYVWRVNRAAMIPLPNGDLYFGSWLDPWVEAQYKFRRYREGDANQITLANPTGYGHSGGASPNIANCAMISMGMEYDTATSNIQSVNYTVAEHGSSSTTSCAPDGGKAPQFYMWVYEAQADGNFQMKATQPANSEVANSWGNYHRITGRNGKLYAVRRWGSRIFEHNPVTNTWNQIIGTGVQGQCADGTPALSCDIDPQDMWVTAQNQIFFVDRGRIRTLDSANRVVTIFGQSLTSGDGGDPILARFGKLWSLAIENDGRLMVYDSNRLREVTADRSGLSTIAGNGRPGWVRDNSVAASSVFYEGVDWSKSVLTLDPATNDVFYPIMNSGDDNVFMGRLNRSTGRWEKAFGGGGAGTRYFDADGLVGASARLGIWGDFTSSWADGFLPIGYGAGKLVTALSTYPEPNPAWSNSMIKLYDSTDSWRQQHLVGRGGNALDNYTFCADGNDVNSCNTPLFAHVSRPQYDATGDRWLLLNGRGQWFESARISSVPDNNGDSAPRAISTLVNLPRTAVNFAYWRTGGHEYVYYCSKTGYIYRYDVTGGTETPLSLPSPEMKCLPETNLDLDRANGVLYFNFERNKLHAIGSVNAI